MAAQKPPWKPCGRPARLVVIEDPSNPNPFCKEHGPEGVLKRMGFLYRKANAGEKCGQSSNVEHATLEMMKSLGETGDYAAALDVFKKVLREKR